MGIIWNSHKACITHYFIKNKSQWRTQPILEEIKRNEVNKIPEKINKLNFYNDNYLCYSKRNRNKTELYKAKKFSV